MQRLFDGSVCFTYRVKIYYFIYNPQSPNFFNKIYHYEAFEYRNLRETNQDETNLRYHMNVMRIRSYSICALVAHEPQKKLQKQT